MHDTGEAHGQAPGRMGELLGQFSVATFKTSEQTRAGDGWVRKAEPPNCCYRVQTQRIRGS